MRLFIAVDLSREADEEILRVQSLIVDENLKASKTKSFHLTLKFLGEVEEENVSKIIDELKKIKFTPFSLKLSNAGVFPDKNNVRVLWIGLEESSELKKLYLDIKKSLPQFKDDRDFSPHITLARVSFVKDRKSFFEKLEKTEVEAVESNINSFILYKSTLTSNVSVYEKLTVFK